VVDAVTDREPFVAKPVSVVPASQAEQESAFVEDQVSVTDPPGVVLVGNAVRETVGAVDEETEHASVVTDAQGLQSLQPLALQASIRYWYAVPQVMLYVLSIKEVLVTVWISKPGASLAM
jgi:hypothetical protein